jgi:sRNA-binding carbon storage regulator CsrA
MASVDDLAAAEALFDEPLFVEKSAGGDSAHGEHHDVVEAQEDVGGDEVDLKMEEEKSVAVTREETKEEVKEEAPSGGDIIVIDIPKHEILTEGKGSLFSKPNQYCLYTLNVFIGDQKVCSFV